MDDIGMIPLPSQLDDWHLFERYEGEMIRQRRGSQGYLDWKTLKAEQGIQREEWKRAMKLGTEVSLRRISKGCSTKMSDEEEAAVRDHQSIT